MRQNEAAQKLIKFVNASPTPFHAVQQASLLLEQAGFGKLLEKEEWGPELRSGGKYYFTRNQSAVVAFTLPKNFAPGAGLSIVATHIDSPNLRVRPVSKKSSQGYLQVGVETYGGGIWHSWFDRDLSVAGRVIVASRRSNDFTSRLIKIDRPLLRIPSLAIHLDRSVNEQFKFNQESQFVPILGLVSQELNEDTAFKGEQKVSASNIQNNHHPALLRVLAQELDVEPEEIHDFELALYDTQPSTIGGVNNEFIFSPRLDNQLSSFCAVEALIESVSGDAPGTQTFPLDGNVNCIALFNHEEVGSVSTSGAQSSLIPDLLHRLSPEPESHAMSVARSFLISSDVGHAVHPNYSDRHEEVHRPVMNGGIVIKTNANQRYASDAIGSFLVKKLVERRGGKVQAFETRNDMPCGSTVGPMLSRLGIRTIDVGNAILSMHSIRETTGTQDVRACIDLFAAFFEGFAALDTNLRLD